jgi:hypothetical protein
MYFDMYILFSDKDGEMLTDKSIWLSLRGGDKRLIDVNYFLIAVKSLGCALVSVL